MADDTSTDVPDTGVGDAVVTVTAPAATLNWMLLGAVIVGVWWVYSHWDEGDDDYEDG